MITIGKLIKEARLTKKLSRRGLGDITKIRENFIAAIEEEKWSSLPEKAVVSGFIKSLAGVLDVDLNQAMAFFRRDYPQVTAKFAPKPDLPTRFAWSPRLTFILGSVAVFVIVGLYLLLQYLNFIKPPKLLIETPSENQEITTNIIKVEGSTDTDATVVVNNQPVVVTDDGKFMTDLEVAPQTTSIEVKARSRFGKETVVVRSISVKLK